MFDGKNTNKWSIDWPIDDSAMASPNTGKMLYSTEQFDNFELRIDFKVNKGGNSGFFIRNTGDWYCSGFEIAVLDSKDGGDAGETSNPDNKDILPAGIFDVNSGKDFPTGGNAPIKRSGAIYDIYPTTKNGVTLAKGGVYVDLMKPAMQWNSMVVWANGKNIETWLNGTKVTDLVIGSADFNARYHKSKFPNSYPYCNDSYSTSPKGVLVVQDHGGGLNVWIRNIKLRPIIPGSKLPMPLFTPIGGTISASTKISLDAGITGATVRYTLDGSDPSESSPIYIDSTGLKLTGSSIVKSRTFRDSFAASEVASANFTVSGTSGINLDPSRFSPVKLIQSNKSLFFNFPGNQFFSAQLVNLAGQLIKAGTATLNHPLISLENLPAGIYIVEIKQRDLNFGLKGSSEKILIR